MKRMYEDEPEEASELLTVPEVAQKLRVDDTTVRRWIKAGTLEAVTLPHPRTRKSYRIKRETLDALLGTPTAPSTGMRR